ncbi:MAG: PaaI family thioesterase [Myxococcales bacterium]|nr:PaaI family thioesterase [Myxococcales bacterium]
MSELDEARKQRILVCLAYVQDDLTGFHAQFGMRLLEWSEGKAKVALDVTPAVANPFGMLHGGMVATLIDHAGTIAILTADRDTRPGVTTDLNITYFLPTPRGDTALAEASVLRAGRTLAMVNVDVRRASDGKLVAQGRMTKYQG